MASSFLRDHQKLDFTPVRGLGRATGFLRRSYDGFVELHSIIKLAIRRTACYLQWHEPSI